MTIKIITRGVDPKTWPWRGTCYNCGTTFECDKSDTKHHDNYDCRDPREQPYDTATCPVCNHQARVAVYKAHDGRGPG